MDYLQYVREKIKKVFPHSFSGFKPYYKWITFNTGIFIISTLDKLGFKPYYKWITFNTKKS